MLTRTTLQACSIQEYASFMLVLIFCLVFHSLTQRYLSFLINWFIIHEDLTYNSQYYLSSCLHLILLTIRY